LKAPDIAVNIVENPSDVSDFWDWLTHRPHGYVACDIESGSNPVGHELEIFKPGFLVRMMQFGDHQSGWAIPFQEWKGLVRGAFEWISESRTTHVWHNGFGFDAQALRQEGILLDPTLMHDTMIDAGLQGFAGEGKKLKSLARREFGDWAVVGANILDNAKKNAGWTWTDFPMDWKPYPVYGVVDTVITAMLYEKFRESDPTGMFTPHHDMEIAASVITNQMARTGMMVDGEYLHDQILEYARREEELLAKARSMGWGSPSKDAEVRRILKEAGVLDEKRITESGIISVDKKQLINVQHPLAELVLEYRWVHRVRTSYLEKLMGMIGGELAPGLIHPSIWSMAARTGRMSVSDPPAQQFPANDPVVRQAFIPDNPDHVMISADFGQIEMRAWAILNKDAKLIEMLNEADRTGEDFFVLMARDLYQEPGFQKSDKRRGPIKNTAYATIFAGGDAKIAETAGLPLVQVQPVINALKKAYPSFGDAGQSMVSPVDGGKAFEIWTPNGRRFKVRDYKDKRVLPNWCTQGWAATILKDSAIACRAAGLGDSLRLAVHDELLFSVPREDARDAAAEIESIMSGQITKEEYGVDVYAKPTIGNNWSELK
jgi:DNA polymerase-1